MVKTGARADAFACWPAQFVGREIHVRDYYEAVGQPLAAHLNWLRAKGHGPERAQFWLPHDGASNDKVFDVSSEQHPVSASRRQARMETSSIVSVAQPASHPFRTSLPWAAS